MGFYRNLRSESIYGVAPHLDTWASDVVLIGVKGPRQRFADGGASALSTVERRLLTE